MTSASQNGAKGLPHDIRQHAVLLREVRAATSEKTLRLRKDELLVIRLL